MSKTITKAVWVKKNKDACAKKVNAIKSSYGYSLGAKDLSGHQARLEIKALKARLTQCNVYGWKF
jgi:hypothetical protein